MSIHLKLNGLWSTCKDEARCELLYHLPMTMRERLKIPESFLTELLGIEDNPDQIDVNGIKYWTNEAGALHRDYDMPAIIQPSGAKTWLRNGKAHRDYDRPAKIDDDGTLSWYYANMTHRLGDKPAVIFPDGSAFWFYLNKPHRDYDRPAAIYVNDRQEWWTNGAVNRFDGKPAVIHADGREEYWINDVKVPNPN